MSFKVGDEVTVVGVDLDLTSTHPYIGHTGQILSFYLTKGWNGGEIEMAEVTVPLYGTDTTTGFGFSLKELVKTEDSSTEEMEWE